MMIPVKCPKCGTEGICMTVKIGDQDVWMDCCYHCGTKLVENGKAIEYDSSK